MSLSHYYEGQTLQTLRDQSVLHFIAIIVFVIPDVLIRLSEYKAGLLGVLLVFILSVRMIEALICTVYFAVLLYLFFFEFAYPAIGKGI